MLSRVMFLGMFSIGLISLPQTSNACSNGGVGDPPILILSNMAPVDAAPADVVKSKLILPGLKTINFAESHSCGIVAELPANVRVASVNVVDSSDPKKEVGFTGFSKNNKVGKKFCADLSRYCVAYVSGVKSGGLDDGVPVQIELELQFETGDEGSSIIALAAELARNGTITTTGLDSELNPIHHITVHSPSKVSIEFPHE